jgi:hypothetical protein
VRTEALSEHSVTSYETIVSTFTPVESYKMEAHYLRTHARIPTAVMAFPEYDVSHTRYWNKDLLVHGWRPVQWIAVYSQMRVDE